MGTIFGWSNISFCAKLWKTWGKTKRTHHFQLQRAALAVAFNIRRDARIISGLVYLDALQSQVTAAGYDARFGIVLDHLALRRHRAFGAAQERQEQERVEERESERGREKRYINYSE